MQTGQITILLQQLKPDDKAQINQVYELLYNDIKAIANHQLSQLHNNQTISATVLAHECYIKLVQAESIQHQDRRHLLNYLAKAMRRFMIDQIRAKNRQKRQGQLNYDQLSQLIGMPNIETDLLEIDRLIDTLAEIKPHLAELFQQKVLFNFTFKELAEIFDLSERQIIRQWTQVKALMLTLIEKNHET
ncbi:ECF-type sigma factor [Marinicella marina]|nr:ECF-type sigma factor [Marinicella marina]